MVEQRPGLDRKEGLKPTETAPYDPRDYRDSLESIIARAATVRKTIAELEELQSPKARYEVGQLFIDL